ncbi:hypothetical protein EDC52_101322 [Biostraticola tofi]|uniref:UPF0181 protein EDC52_101322 n=1 Tax=Biostraticola tofi TaxID=466109 RepID=A0A4R3Z701_9GAMM|nr:YoaH family protein [Biostraticola tofi]TCV99980.1 hypothetical protein EDC52_101322 [Biostraticola tofi]
MLNNMPALTHEQQQVAVERIQALMAEGMSSGEAIALVSREIRENHTGERVTVRWDDEDEEAESATEYTHDYDDGSQESYPGEDTDDDADDEQPEDRSHQGPRR